MSVEQWQNVVSVDELEIGDVTAAKLNGLALAVFDAKVGIVVSDAKCTHAGANLCDGYFDGESIECPLHQGLFDVQTGKAKAAPVVKPIRIYESRIKDGFVQIKIAPNS